MSATITPIDERLPPHDPLAMKVWHPEPAQVIILPVVRRFPKSDANYARGYAPGGNEALPSDSEP